MVKDSVYHSEFMMRMGRGNLLLRIGHLMLGMLYIDRNGLLCYVHDIGVDAMHDVALCSFCTFLATSQGKANDH